MKVPRDVPLSHGAGMLIRDMDNDRAQLFFDGGCGICSEGARRWERLLATRQIEMIPFQVPAAGRLLNRNPADPLPPEMQLLTPDGRIIGGVDVIAYAARRFWWAYPVHLMLLVPPLRALAGMGYRWLARRRARISQTCGLRPLIDTKK